MKTKLKYNLVKLLARESSKQVGESWIEYISFKRSLLIQFFYYHLELLPNLYDQIKFDTIPFKSIHITFSHLAMLQPQSSVYVTENAK